ncbi:hypothetical protein G7046_g1326 [Stylonectria norvegica]|nr:hypothetical protein G7046_g1326 [Stylonectria norvegica]
MDIDPPHNSTIRSFDGCWTCRLRRKKCDEKRPACDTCGALHITCYYGQDKPEWMDGAARQKEMAEQLKREVKERARHRRGEPPAHAANDRVSSDRVSSSEDGTSDSVTLATLSLGQGHTVSPATSTRNGTSFEEIREPYSETSTMPTKPNCAFISKNQSNGKDLGRSDTILLMFYLEHLLPFLFPFYRPSLLQGGRAWILEMMISSPVIRQATLCQSSYFFCLAQGTIVHDEVWGTVLAQTKGAFGILGQALSVIDGSGIEQHLGGAIRILVSIIQVQRFEVSIRSFDNCQSHLSAALALFTEVIACVGPFEPAEVSARFDDILGRLGPSSWILPEQCVQVPSAEQAAFRFSASLLILDDLIASTVLQEVPKLFHYYPSLLGETESTRPTIDLEDVVGCQNWVLMRIGEIAALDAWKQRCKRVGDLDVMQLVHCAKGIKDSLETQFTRFENTPVRTPGTCGNLLDSFSRNYRITSTPSASQGALVTRVWAHAAFIYLSVVVSGWQPASVEVRYHVSRVIELLTVQISPPELLRTMVWPFCVAGCLAEPAQEASLRGMVEALQPQNIFGTTRKALEIMENVWRNRVVGDLESRDLAMCFRSEGDLVLLV